MKSTAGPSQPFPRRGETSLIYKSLSQAFPYSSSPSQAFPSHYDKTSDLFQNNQAIQQLNLFKKEQE